MSHTIILGDPHVGIFSHTLYAVFLPIQSDKYDQWKSLYWTKHKSTS
jgi:hypothetical protein